MAVSDTHVFPGFLTPVLTQLSFQSQLLFWHASAETRGENTPQRKFASSGSRTRNHQVMSLTCSPLSHPVGAYVWYVWSMVYQKVLLILMGCSTLFHLYQGGQCTHPCFPGVLLTNTPHDILSKPLAAFLHNHCQNNGQSWERNESCRNDYHQSLERILAKPAMKAATSCSQVRNTTDWAMGLSIFCFSHSAFWADQSDLLQMDLTHFLSSSKSWTIMSDRGQYFL